MTAKKQKPEPPEKVVPEKLEPPEQAALSDSTNISDENVASAMLNEALSCEVALDDEERPASLTQVSLNGEEIDLADPKYYHNRELTWLNFNLRVLHEAQDKRTKLLERLKFVAIVCSNLDEFYMKRIGGLKQQVGAGITKLSIDGRTPMEQIRACLEVIAHIEIRKSSLYSQLVKELEENKIFLLNYAELNLQTKAELRSYYFQEIFPLITPQGIDPAHPFPFISNLSLNLLVNLRHPGHGEISLARVKIPVSGDVPRFVQVGDSNRFVRIEEIVSNNLDLLFPKMLVQSVEVFRLTRNAVTELDEEQADDLLSMIETELRYRRFATIVRMQVSKGMDPIHKGMLAAEFGLNEQQDVVEVEGFIGKSDLMQIAGLDLPDLHDSPYSPIDHPRLKDDTKIFYKLRRDGPMLLFHPYESFSSSVERFLSESSQDPKVRAIKMTLYRTSRDSKVIQYLLDAARNGKQVAVVVELKARFDEAANILWATRLEEAGIHVTYGVVGLKTHSKVIMVVRKDYNGLRRYMHFSTGNYHAGTARMYTDFGLFTCDDQVGVDVTEYFNYLTTGYSPKRNYKKILVSPADMKRTLLRKIQREIDHRKKGRKALIRIKTNALQDADIIAALYRASMAGVKVELLVRDTCCLRPGMPGISENIRVVSIVGRFLEHARLYYFYNGAVEEYYIGSADCMSRNLESRVETLVPVETPSLQEELGRILEIQMADRRCAWVMNEDGSYTQLQPGPDDYPHGSQAFLMSIAERRRKASAVLKRLKSGGKSRKEFWNTY